MTLWYSGLNLTLCEEVNILRSETDVGWYPANDARLFTIFDFTWVVEFLFKASAVLFPHNRHLPTVLSATTLGTWYPRQELGNRWSDI